MRRILKSCACVMMLTLLSAALLWCSVRLQHFIPLRNGFHVVLMLVSVAVTSLVLMVAVQFVFGVRRRAALFGRPVVALLLLAAGLACLDRDSVRSSCLYVPVGFLTGEGFWMRRVGEADAAIDGRRIRYDAYVDVHRANAPLWKRDNVFLVARDPVPLSSGGHPLDRLALSRKDMHSVNDFCMIRLPILPSAVSCRVGISLRPHFKAELFKTMDITVTNGLRRYECAFERWYPSSTNFFCAVDESFFGQQKED